MNFKKITLSDITELEEYYDDTLKEKNIDISIFCLTYNHKPYIRETFEGFINQKINKTIEILVFDDASIDGTSDIVREYALKYPEFFHAVIARQNTYGNVDRNRALLNFLKINLRGKYVTICEGDDYWIYDRKLQKQYDLMESMPNISLCFHNAIRYDRRNEEVIPQILDMDSGIIDADEIFFALQGRPATASMMLKCEYWHNAPYFFDISAVGDEPLRFWCAYNGDIYYIDKCWSVRSYMHDGSWNSSMKNQDEFRSRMQMNYVFFMLEYDNETNGRFYEQVERKIVWLCSALLKSGNIEDMSLEEFDGWKKEGRRCLGDNYDVMFNKLYAKLVKLVNNYFYNMERILESKGKKKVVYGAGKFGRFLKKYLDRKNINIDMFCQSKVEIQNSVVDGIPLVDMEYLKGHDESMQVFVAIGNPETSKMIVNQLLQVLPENDEIYELGAFINFKLKSGI